MAKCFFPAVQIELGLFATLQEVTEINAAQIEAFKKTYWAHSTTREYIRDEMSPEFVMNLAHDATTAKTHLRTILRRSQYWNENIQACVLPLIHPFTPNPKRTYDLIAQVWRASNNWYALAIDTREKLLDAADWLAGSGSRFDVIEELLPRKYHRKKKTTIFAKLSEQYDLANYTRGSYYQRQQEEISCWLNGEDYSYKLYVSINPAHFLSMSNPKGDDRGEMMTSCHSFNGEYRYKSGSIGYARDNVTLCVFTAANDGAGLLNRKTARQLFFYYDGALVQSRLYTSRNGGSYGGVAGDLCDHWQIEEFRHALQDLLSHGEGYNSKWRFTDYRKPRTNPKTGNRNRNAGQLNRYGVQLYANELFGGYADWEAFSDEHGMIVISRLNAMKDKCTSFTVGEAGLYLQDGNECNYAEDEI